MAKRELKGTRPAFTKKTPPQSVCPACGVAKITGTAGFGQAYSRYVSTYICAGCGSREAFKGFFWRDRAEGSQELRSQIKTHHRGKE